MLVCYTLLIDLKALFPQEIYDPQTDFGEI